MGSIYARFEVLTAATMEFIVFWNVVLGRMIDMYYCFKERFFLHFLGKNNYPDEGGNWFVLNIIIYP